MARRYLPSWVDGCGGERIADVALVDAVEACGRCLDLRSGRLRRQLGRLTDEEFEFGDLVSAQVFVDVPVDVFD
ncbi:hypothetical protein CSW57_17790 [Williamsia muralis]|uniref:Uncharacterized protein n=1 Tax=Williamsia marianensis TaxID=85044 RepID=A0A2G3PIN5_WILMA|nr:hypothetical protein CSW57_17790 [Williamsia marianensis]